MRSASLCLFLLNKLNFVTFGMPQNIGTLSKNTTLNKNGDEYEGVQLSKNASKHFHRRRYRFTKRVFDIVFSAGVSVVLFVPSLILSGVIAINTKGSPIYTQRRIGKNGKPFTLMKFRSMVADADDVEKYLNEEQLAQWKAERKVEN